jgi:Family of unknown function (DUF6152)
MKRMFLVVLAAAALVGVRASAHHSQVAVYDSSKTQVIEGKIVAVKIRSPHSWVDVEVNEKDEDGKPLRYGIEWGSASQLTRSGIDNKTLKIGDVVKVTGRPGRQAADHRLLVMSMVRPSDGWKWPTREGEVVD